MSLFNPNTSLAELFLNRLFLRFRGRIRISIISGENLQIVHKKIDADGFLVTSKLVEDLDRIQTLRRSNTSFEWLNYTSGVFSEKQLSLDNEFEHTDLIVRIPGADKLNDLVLFESEGKLINFIAPSKLGKLSTHDKALIGTMLSEEVKQHLNSLSENASKIKASSTFHGQTQQKLKKIEEENYRLNGILKEIIRELSQQILKENRLNFKIFWTDEALFKINNLYQQLPALKQIITECLQSALLRNESEHILTIKPFDLPERSLSKTEAIPKPIEENIQKEESIIRRLEQLEAHAKFIVNSNEKLILKTLGNAIDKTPSAITQFIRKYEVEIFDMLHSNPGRYPFLINHFKPIKSLLKRKESKAA